MNVLLSYGIWGPKPLEQTLVELFGDDRAEWPRVMVDSGAVQAANTGKPIDADVYGRWLKAAEGWWDEAISLDVIFDPQASERNHRVLVYGHGLSHVMPVFHGGEPWEYLERMAATHGKVALGGMVTSRVGRSGLWPWLARAFRVARAHDAAVHGLGMTRWGEMLRLPWSSVDSSSWGAGHRFGQVAAWNGRTLVKGSRARPGPELLRLLRRAGFDPHELGDYRYAAEVNAFAWLQMERAVQHARPDFRLYLVDGAPFALQAVQKAWRRLP